MGRHLVSIPALSLALVITMLACGTPAEDQPGSPAAQATSARRTAVADVQRVIANNPTPTPQPAATATPVPTCQNAIWWMEAGSHVGESRTVQGTVVGSRSAPGGIAMLELGLAYPDPIGLAVLLPPSTRANLDGKAVCVTGRIATVEGQPMLQVQDPSSIVVLN